MANGTIVDFIPVMLEFYRSYKIFGQLLLFVINLCSGDFSDIPDTAAVCKNGVCFAYNVPLRILECNRPRENKNTKAGTRIYMWQYFKFMIHSLGKTMYLFKKPFPTILKHLVI